MKKLIATLAVLSALSSTSAFAATDYTGFYIGGGGSNIDLDIKHVNGDFSANGATLYGGYNFSDWMGIEGTISAATGLGKNGVDLSIATFSVGPKFTFILSDKVSLFTKVALASTALEDDSNDWDDDWDWDDEADWSGFGYSLAAGVHFAMTDKLNLRLSYEYTDTELDADSRYDSDLDGELNIITLGLHYQF